MSMLWCNSPVYLLILCITGPHNPVELRTKMSA